uniref:IF rod domain-containing protein n=1 Tax=Otolemur garnettii TaxID=30611 RepID=H0XI48_OTOGA
KTDHWRLESKIQDHLVKKGPQVRDWVHYCKTIKDLILIYKIFSNSLDQGSSKFLSNAHLAANDFRAELPMHQSVRSNIYGLHKVIDKINVALLPLKTGVKALKEELLFIKNNHKEERKGLQSQIDSSGLTMEVDPKSLDYSKIMADIWAHSDDLAQKNQEKLDKYWSKLIEKSTTVISLQSADIRAVEVMLTELRHTVQPLEIILDSMRNLKASLENILREVEAHYDMQMEQLNGLLHLESEVAQTWVEIMPKAEITIYSHLLEQREDFNLSDSLDSNSMHIIQKITTCRLVDSKVVSEISDFKVLKG